jgi:hypothetical protein
MRLLIAILCLGLSATAAMTAVAQDAAAPTPQQRVAMLKQWLQASQAQLRTYQWIETTLVSKDGEVKSKKVNQVYYGADGTLQKIPVPDASTPPPKTPHGPLRKHAAEQAKEEMTDYMQSAVSLVHAYLPPDPNRIQQAANSGKMAVNMVVPGQQIRLDFHDYLKPGDVLGIGIDITTNRLLGMQVSSYLDSQSDAVKLDVVEGVLADGTIYTAKTTLNAPAKGVTVVIENTGYRKLGG